MTTFGPAFDPVLDEKRLNEQMERIRDLMMRADGSPWRTLGEISALTLDPEASVSAQLRHLRKKKFGSYVVEKRRRGALKSGLWEYRVLEPNSEEAVAASVLRKTGFLAGLMFAAKIVAKVDDLAEAKWRLRKELLKVAKR